MQELLVLLLCANLISSHVHNDTRLYVWHNKPTNLTLIPIQLAQSLHVHECIIIMIYLYNNLLHGILVAIVTVQNL